MHVRDGDTPSCITKWCKFYIKRQGFVMGFHVITCTCNNFFGETVLSDEVKIECANGFLFFFWKEDAVVINKIGGRGEDLVIEGVFFFLFKMVERERAYYSGISFNGNVFKVGVMECGASSIVFFTRESDELFLVFDASDRDIIVRVEDAQGEVAGTRTEFDDGVRFVRDERCCAFKVGKVVWTDAGH